MIKLPSNIKRIFIDLDDTLVDFMGGLLKLFYGEEKVYTEQDKIDLDHLLRTDSKVLDHMWFLLGKQDVSWYVNLPKLPWCDNLILAARKACYNTTFLTSPGTRKEAALVAYSKILWSIKEFGRNELIITKNKHFCANVGCILIDDNIDYIVPWENNGGFPIHLKRWSNEGFTPLEVIKALNEYVVE